MYLVTLTMNTGSGLTTGHKNIVCAQSELICARSVTAINIHCSVFFDVLAK